jgi:PhnB protein
MEHPTRDSREEAAQGPEGSASRTPPSGYTRIVPYLLYEDTTAALEWLAKAFGFHERFRHPVDGTIDHAEMEFSGGMFMLATPGPNYRSPRRLGQTTVVIHVYVDDIRTHYERAKEAGATIEREPTEKPYGTIQYAAEDPEGHLWLFSQQVREPESEWKVESITIP